MQDVLTWLQTIYFLPLAGSVYGLVNMRNHVKGSHPRYVYASITIMFYTFDAIMLMAMASLQMAQGDIGFAILNMVFAIIFSWIVTRIYKDEDNWFKGRWGKMKRGFKRFIAKIPSLLPRPRFA